MKKILMLILISLCILGCKTKKVLKNESYQSKTSEYISTSKSSVKEALKESTSLETAQVKSTKIKESQTDIQISGKVSKENPLIYYNVVNGDTLGSIGISGNADFVIKNSTLNRESKEKDSLNNKSTSDKSKSGSVAATVENISKAVSEVQTKTVEVVKRDFPIGMYIAFVLGSIVVIGLIAGVFYIKKSTWWTKIITKFKPNKNA